MFNQGNNQPDRSTMSERYKSVRTFTNELCKPLKTEDFIPQSMAETSPVRWQIAHTTWLFEQFILINYVPNYISVNPQHNFLFNSYYNTIGDRTVRHHRGLMTRPTLSEVWEYRNIIDSRIHNLIHEVDNDNFDGLCELILIGMDHEQQHQELMLTDIKHLFSLNPMHPIYKSIPDDAVNFKPDSLKFIHISKGVYDVGYTGNEFSYDNEHPRHKTFLHGYKIANRLITNAEYLEFMAKGGYENHKFWLDDGWSKVNEKHWNSPLYWFKENDEWHIFTFNGVKLLKLNEPVCHISFFEADAYARWAGYRLPTEHEWEIACKPIPIDGNFVDSGLFHPTAINNQMTDNGVIGQAYGDLWEWTSSPYRSYPGYKVAEGAIGEYNGKFMNNQFVLRGGSCATSQNHIRPTYRNFFHPHTQWQFSGIRLAGES